MGISKDEKIQLLATAPIPTAIRKLIAPTIISQIVTTLYNMADTFYVGKLGDPYQTAALSLIFPMTMILTFIANLFGLGGNTVISRALGKEDYEKVKRTSSFSFYSTAIIAICLSVVAALFLDKIVAFFGAEDSTSQYAQKYLFYVLVLGALPTTLQLTTAHLIRSEGGAKQASYGMMLGAILNIVLDPILIFVLKNGVVGAAIATLISNIASLLFLLSFAYKNRASSFLSFALRDYSKSYAVEVLQNGLVASCAILVGIIMNTMIIRTTSAYSDIVTASYGIMQKYDTVAMNIAMGVAQGAIPILGYNYSAKNYSRIKDVNKTVFTINLVFSMALLLIVELFTPACVGLFTTHAETIEVATRFTRIAYIHLPALVGIYYVQASFQAFGRWKQGITMNIIRQLVVAVGMVHTLSRFFGVTGIALGSGLSDYVALLFYVPMYVRLLKTIKSELNYQS